MDRESFVVLSGGRRTPPAGAVLVTGDTGSPSGCSGHGRHPLSNGQDNPVGRPGAVPHPTSPARVPTQTVPSGPRVTSEPSLPASIPVPVRTLAQPATGASIAVSCHALTPVRVGRLVQAYASPEGQLTTAPEDGATQSVLQRSTHEPSTTSTRAMPGLVVKPSSVLRGEE